MYAGYIYVRKEAKAKTRKSEVIILCELHNFSKFQAPEVDLAMLKEDNSSERKVTF